MVAGARCPLSRSRSLSIALPLSLSPSFVLFLSLLRLSLSPSLPLSPSLSIPPFLPLVLSLSLVWLLPHSASRENAAAGRACQASMHAENGHFKLSRPRLVPARPMFWTRHIREPLRFHEGGVAGAVGPPRVRATRGQLKTFYGLDLKAIFRI